MAKPCRVQVATFGTLQGQVEGKIIILLDFDEHLLTSMPSTELKVLQTIAEVANLIVWVTSCGLLSAQAPEHAMVSGLGRCLTSERASLDFITLNFNPDTTPESTYAKVILDVVSKRLTERDIRETEYLVDHGVILMSRLVPNGNINEMALSGSDRFEMVPLAANSAFEALPYGEKMLFKDDFSANDALEEGYIGVQVQAIGLGSNVWRMFAIDPGLDTDMDQVSDLSSSSPSLFQFAGIVTRSHITMAEITEGDHVVGFCFRGLSTYQQVPVKLVHRVDRDRKFTVILKPMLNGWDRLTIAVRRNLTHSLLHSNIRLD